LRAALQASATRFVERGRRCTWLEMLARIRRLKNG
jgi:hypothetical protein